jgi:opacity protein-like surface antigen
MKGFILLIAVFLFTNTIIGQIMIGEPTSEQKKQKQKSKSTAVADTIGLKKKESTTAAYLVSNWSKSYRSLEKNGDVYGDTLGIRADEKNLTTWSFGIGMQSQINKHVMWDGGISFLRNGESYSYVASDTSFSYQNFYSYISMPVRINYTIGKDLKFYVGAGLIPQMFTGYRQEKQWTTSTDAKVEETVKTKIGYSSVVLSSVFNVGLILNFKNNWALMVSPEARIQLTSSYPRLDGFIHKGRAYGITFGLTRKI